MLADENMEAGRRILTWDGLTGDGTQASAGVYLVRVVFPTGVQSQSVVVVR